MLHLRHERARDGRQDGADRNRNRDRRSDSEQPGQPHDQEADTDEEPGQQAEIPNPRRRGEDAGEGRCVDLENGGAVGGDGIRLGRLPGGMKAIEEPWHARDSGVFIGRSLGSPQGFTRVNHPTASSAADHFTRVKGIAGW